MIFNTRILILLMAVIAFNCSQSVTRNTNIASFSHQNQPDSLYIEKDVKSSVDSLHVFYQHAVKALNFGDSVGARIYYDKIFSVISEFDEEKKSVLLEWDAYNNLIKKINSDYATIFTQDIYEQEAEEVLEELTDYEEEVFDDSANVSSTGIQPDTNLNLVPLQINRKVELALKYFQTKGRRVFTIWLERSGRYEAMIKSILNEHGLPENLLYLAMIESGFNPKAFSYARASGLWQFIFGTGSYYGLRSNWWFDERRDPILSSHAAARHLIDLYERFDHWYLALAGYNCNPRRIESRIRVQNTRDFWQLRRLPRQTRNYIPTFIAANIIAKDPEKYGFNIEKLEPVVYDTVLISESVDLEIVSQCVDTTFEAIKDINPAVKRWCTPPGIKNFTLNVPEGTKQKFRENYAKIPDQKKRSWVRHSVRSGETLSEVAKKYGSTITVIKNHNKIKGSMIKVGQYLLIPVPQNKNYYQYQVQYAKRTPRKKSNPGVIPRGYKKIIYTVKKGDTIGGIAEVYHTRASNIRAWNGLYYGQYIYPKQPLTIWVPENSTEQGKGIVKKPTELPQGSYHIVQSGDTLWDIAQKYDMSIKDLKKLNGKRSNTIKPGEKLQIREASGG
jgi:membrane-bound lytic murein transglycosylase D